MDSFLLECPHVDINDEPQVDETLEDIMEYHKSCKKFSEPLVVHSISALLGLFTWCMVTHAWSLQHSYDYRICASMLEREWEEFGQGQLLNQLCTKLQENIEEIKYVLKIIL